MPDFEFELLPDEKEGWTTVQGRLLYRRIGIKDQNRADDIHKFFLPFSCEVDVKAFENGYTIKVFFEPK